MPGLVVVAGGKYTTYRVMAKDAVDEAVNALETVNGKKVPKSVTDDVPLLGAEGYHALWNARRLLAQRSGLHEARIEHLLNRYGSLAHEVLALVAGRPDAARAAGRGRRLPARRGRLRGVARGRPAPRRRAGPPHPDLDRDLRPRDRGGREVARLVAPVLGWSDEQVAREVEHYVKRVEAERESQRKPDDETADAARLGAPEIVPVR